MRLNKNGFVARHALKQNPRLHDECSLFTAFTLAMVKRFLLNIMLPVWVIVAVALMISGAMVDGIGWLFVRADGQLVTSIIHSTHFAMQLVIFMPAMMIVAISNVLVAAIVVCGTAWGIFKMAKLGVTKTVEGTPVNVIVTGIKNKWQGVCRPIEFYEE